jgi:hypothetical protein
VVASVAVAEDAAVAALVEVAAAAVGAAAGAAGGRLPAKAISNTFGND